MSNKKRPSIENNDLLLSTNVTKIKGFKNSRNLILNFSNVKCVYLHRYEYKIIITRQNADSNMTSFKRFGSKPMVKYAYIGISADRQRHNLLWLFKYRICPIRIEIIHGGLNIYGFYHGWPFIPIFYPSLSLVVKYLA